MREIKVGSRVQFTSRENAGKGVVAEIKPTLKGPYYKVRTKDHPHGFVSVRRNQVS